MKNRLKFGFTLLVLLFTGQTVLAYISADAKPHSVIQPAEQETKESSECCSPAVLLSAQANGFQESTVRNPFSSSGDEQEAFEENFPAGSDSSPFLTQAKIYLTYAGLIEPGLSVRKLLFPFHSHL